MRQAVIGPPRSQPLSVSVCAYSCLQLPIVSESVCTPSPNNFQPIRRFVTCHAYYTYSVNGRELSFQNTVGNVRTSSYNRKVELTAMIGARERCLGLGWQSCSGTGTASLGFTHRNSLNTHTLRWPVIRLGSE